MGKKQLYVLVSLFVLYALPALVHAQVRQLRFRHYKTEEGLSQADVFNIAQDSRSFMWFSTFDGLNRFDGYSFKIFRPDHHDSNAIRGERINGIIENKDHFLWVGTNEALNRYNPVTGTFDCYYVNQGNGQPLKTSYHPFFIDDRNELWFTYSTFNLGSMNLRTLKVTLYSFADGLLNEHTSAGFNSNVFFKPLSQIYSCGTDGLHIIDVKNRQVQYYFSANRKNLYGSKTSFRQVLAENDGSLWLSGKDGLLLFNTATRKKELFNWLPGTGEKFTELSSIVKDKQGILWCGSYGMGLSIFDPLTKTFLENYRKDPSDPESISNNAVTALFIDRDDNIWAGIDLEGVDKMNPFYEQLRHVKVKLDSEGPSYTGSVWSIAELDPENVLLVTNHRDLIIYDKTAGKCRKFDMPGSFKNATVFNAFTDSRKRIWIGCEKGLFYSDDRLAKIQALIRKELYYDVYFFECNKRLFVGTGNCLFSIDIEQPSAAPDTIPFLTGKRTTCITQLPNGLLCVASASKELLLIGMNNGQFTLHAKKTFDFLVKSVAFGTGADTLWLGTTTGLVRYIVSENSLNIFTEKDGLANNFVYSIVRANDGSLWMSTNKGISRYDPAANRFSNFGFEEGVQSLEFNSHSSYQAGSGTIYFGGVKGFNYFDPATVRINGFSPRIEVLNMTINSEAVPVQQYLAAGKAIEFASDENNITIEFAAIDFNRNMHINYLYRLDSAASWISAGNNRLLSFANMPPGNYHLEVKAQHSYNTSSPYLLKLPFRIRPPFYNNGWFIAVSFVVLLLLIYLLYRYRINQFLKLQTMRNNIARDLHDEVGATLSGISMYTHLTRDQNSLQDIAGVEKSLHVIQQNADEMVHKLNDIVWLVNPDQDSLLKLVQRLEEYAFEMAEVRNMTMQIQLPANIEQLSLSMNIRRNIFLIYKEAINNAVKYSGGSLLRFEVSLTGNQLACVLTDNGKGFDAAAVRKGNGLENMQKRAEDIGGVFHMQATPGKGSSVSIKIKIT